MPRLDGADVETHTLAGSNFTFTGARIAGLGATEYTLVDIEVDGSTSVGPFRGDVVMMLETAIDACRKSPRSDNLLVRVAVFSDRHPKGTMEIHGFRPLSELDPGLYQNFRTGGSTPLLDACYMGVGAMNAYAKMLSDSDYLANGITFIITDGDDNASTSTADMVRAEIAKATQTEIMESHISVLIGINAAHYATKLASLKNDVGITQFIDAGDATKGKLAKLAAFVSQSISSTSQALGTGGPSQAIAATV